MRLNHSPYWVSSVVYDKNILPTNKAGIYKARPPFIAKLGLRTELGELFYGFLGGQNGHYILLRAGAPASLPQLVLISENSPSISSSPPKKYVKCVLHWFFAMSHL